MEKRLLILALVSVAATGSAQIFNDFEGGTVGAAYGFRLPNFSGSTSGNLAGAPAPNIMQVEQGFGSNDTKVGRFSFQFVDDSATRWARLTTFGAAGRPNPTVRLDQWLLFDIYTTVDLRLALLIRETGNDVAVGADGGTANGIEFVSSVALGSASGRPDGGQLIAAGSWQRVGVNLASPAAVKAFAGTTANGVLEAPFNKGVLEALAITPAGGAGPYDIYVDNFEVSPVPEPGTMIALGGGLVALLGRRRAKRA